MLSKKRVKRTKPTWTGDEASSEFLKYWDSEKSKEISSQNKVNQSSSRGGALLLIGHKSHLDITLDLECKYGQPVESDKLFIAIHTKKNGGLVDGHSRETYENYHESLRVI